MVNNGPSSGCFACRHQRKKCDEQRPACLRCCRAHRICPGYGPSKAELSKEHKFINYISAESHAIILRGNSAEPPRPAVSIPFTEVSDIARIEQHARRQFFNDYCIVSQNRELSRGYLHGLEAMVEESGPDSDLAKACILVALATSRKPSRNTIANGWAEDLYSSLLQSFRLSISNTTQFVSVKSLLTAALLGLYEMICCSNGGTRAWVAHAQGISAILLSKNSPVDLLCNGKIFQVGSPCPQENSETNYAHSSWIQHSAPIIGKLTHKFSIFCTPLFNQPSLTMDSVYDRTMQLLRRAESLFQNEATLDQLLELERDSEQLKAYFANWPETIPPEWIPKPVGIISPTDKEAKPRVGYWPGTVSCYYDLYVASLWNNYRKAYLLVLNVIMICYKRTREFSSHFDLTESIKNEASSLTEGIVSSIPFILSNNLDEFVEHARAEAPAIVPGRPVGALLSMHTLFVLSTLSTTETALQTYIKDCLAWIGSIMGIAQAAELSEYTIIGQFRHATEARIIIWTGMLI